MDILSGMVIGNEESTAIIKCSKGIVYIPSANIGGEAKNNKAKSFIGATISFLISGKNDDTQLGDRVAALEHMKNTSKAKVGDHVKAKILMLFAKSMLVECEGREVYIPVHRCLPYWTDDMQTTGEFQVGDEISVKIEEMASFVLRVDFEQDVSAIKTKGNYLGEVKSVISKGSFVQLLISNTIVQCHAVDWRRALMVGDLVSVEISEIREDYRVFGLVRRRNRGSE